MTDQHRATDEQWHWQAIKELLPENPRSPLPACLLELRDRIQQLESTQPPRLPAPAPSPSPSTLVDRVANALYSVPLDSDAEARAAIREVAAWLLEQDPEPGVVGRLLGQISTPCGVMADLLMHEAGQ